MAYTRTTEVTDLAIALHSRPGQDLVPRLRASITETLRDEAGEVVPYPENRTAILLAEDITDDLIAQINAAIGYAGVQMVRAAPDKGVDG